MLQNVEYVKDDSFSRLEDFASYGKLEKTPDKPVMQATPNMEKVNVPMICTTENVSYWLSDCLTMRKI
jgi:hypothetical protein